MQHPLQRQIRDVARRAGRLRLLYACGRVVACLIAAVLLAGLLDYLIRFEDPGLRTIFLLMVAGVGGWAAWRYFLPVWRTKSSDVDVALRIERRFPRLRDQLASTLEFLQQREDDPTAGSAMLRRAVVAQTAADLANVDVRDVLDTRPALRSAGLAALVLAVAGMLIALNPAASQLALTRLALPWGGPEWPRKNLLAFENPATRVALHQPVEFRVVAEADSQLPDEATLHLVYHDAEGNERIETEPMQRLGDALVLRRDRVTQPFNYYATGGDGRTADIQLQVEEPPRLQSFTVKLHPPAYTTWQPVAVEERIRAIAGTRVDIAGKVDKPLRSARVVVGESLGEPQRFAAQITADRLGFHLSPTGDDAWQIAKSGSYWFELIDEEGFPGGGDVRYDVRAEDDLPPSIDISQPTANIFVTATASVPVVLRAEDDLALQNVTLFALRSDKSDAGEERIVSFDVERPKTSSPAPGTAASDDRRHKFEQEYLWQLADMQLKPGTQLTFHAIAGDYLPQTGTSQPRRLTIITPTELEERIAGRQSLIIGELDRALRMEQQARSQTEGISIQLDKVGELTKEDVDGLQAAGLTQRQVERTLTSPSEGIAAQVRQLLEELHNNHVDSPEIERRMSRLADEIDRLGREHLPIINRELTSAQKEAQSRMSAGQQDQPVGEIKPLLESISAVEEHQDAVVSSLGQLRDELSQWDNYRRFHGELGRMRREQEEIAAGTAELGRETITKPLQDLTPQQQADLAKFSGQQQDLARRFDKLRERMQAAANELDESDPLAADALADALHMAQDKAPGGTMREAARSLEQNQIGQAAAGQQQALDDLAELLDTLSHRREHELSRLVKKLGEAEQQVQELRDKQAKLKRKFADAKKIENEKERRRELERLTREQEQLEREASRLARLSRRLQADAAGNSLRRAAGSMQQGSESGAAGDADQAEQNADAAEPDLEAAQQQLAQRRQQAEFDLAVEQLAKLRDSLVGLHDRQQQMVVDIERLAELYLGQNETFTPGQQSSLHDLADVQRFLAEETDLIAEDLSAAKVFALALDGAAADMRQAAEHLDDHDVGERAQSDAKSALRRLAQLLEALAPEKQDDGAAGAGQGGEPQAGNQMQMDGIPSLAQLKLLKLMQEDLNERTQQIAARFPDGQFDAEAQQEFNRLGAEQGRLADLTLDMLQQVAASSEDDPENLPGDVPDEEQPPKHEPKGLEGLEKDLFDDVLDDKELDQQLDRELFGPP